MKKLLFRLHNVLIAADGMGDVELTDKSYSCLWDVYKCVGGDDYVQIDVASVRSQDDDGDWRRDRVPNNVIAELEERLQLQLDQEALRIRRMNREVA